MKTVKDECSWSSPKGTLPWSEGTNVMDCSCQPLLGGFQPCSWPRTTFQFNWPPANIPSSPRPCPRDMPDSWAGASRGHSPAALSLLRRWDGLQLAKACPASPRSPATICTQEAPGMTSQTPPLFPRPKNTMHACIITNCAILFSEDGL